jgi:biotin carboxylase
VVGGVVSPCTDVAVPTAAYIAEELGLMGPSLSSASIVCSKSEFRDFQKEHHYSIQESFQVTSEFRPDPAIFDHQSWILKPDRSSGSKGVIILNSPEDWEHHLAQMLSFSSTRMGILEKFIEGFQGTCEGILRGGEILHAFVLDRQTVDPPFTTTCGHHVPSLLPTRPKSRLLDLLTATWKTLKVTDGPFDCDFVATQDEVYLLEITPRLGGNSIATLLRRACGFDIVKYSILQAMGEEPELPAQLSCRPTAVVILGVMNGGRLAYDQSQAQLLSREEWVDSLSFDVAWGADVRPFINSRHRLGQAIVFGKDRPDLDAKVIELKKRLDLRAT